MCRARPRLALRTPGRSYTLLQFVPVCQRSSLLRHSRFGVELGGNPEMVLECCHFLDPRVRSKTRAPRMTEQRVRAWPLAHKIYSPALMLLPRTSPQRAAPLARTTPGFDAPTRADETRT